MTRLTWREAGTLAAVVVTAVAVYAWVDLQPAVQQEFFFAEDDPQLESLREIDRRFPPTPQVVVRVAGSDVRDQSYRDQVDDLGARLLEIPDVRSVYSIATENPGSPLWSRLLLVPDSSVSNVVLEVEPDDPAALVHALDAVLADAEGPSFSLEASGVPVIVERIRRNLFRDLVVFSLAAILAFGALVGLVYRRVRVVVGTLATCLTACGLTLLVSQAGGLRIGLLTANIVTIVFVLTLSHIVFLTGNFRRALTGVPVEGDATDPTAHAGGHSNGSEASRAAVRWTIGPSFWCMLTTVLGFSSLLLATARPLRELGMAGALGTVVAFGAAFLLYPPFLKGLGPAGLHAATTPRLRLPDTRQPRWLLAIALAVVVAGSGLWRLDTDPGLLSYFAVGGDVRTGLELIDRDGGSSILKVIVRDADGASLGSREVYDELWAFQDALEQDPSVGVVVSPAVLVAHARSQPLAGFLPIGMILDILDSGLANEIGTAFVAGDRGEGLFLLRMREGDRSGSREAVLSRIREHAVSSGLDPVLVGGLYDLQAALGRLIADSLKIGLGALVILFLIVAAVVTRSFPTTVAMVACLTAIPLVVLGTFGHLGIAVDIVTSPAANVALAMGVDSMIHLVSRVRSIGGGVVLAERWQRARGDLQGPVLAATLMISVGFGIFALSTFPPTRRFGFAVILGTVTAGAMTLVALPLAAGLRAKRS